MNYNSDYYTGAYLVLEGNWAPPAATGGTPADPTDPINSPMAATVKVLTMEDGPLGGLVVDVPAPMPSINFEVETMMGGASPTADEAEITATTPQADNKMY